MRRLCGSADKWEMGRVVRTALCYCGSGTDRFGRLPDFLLRERIVRMEIRSIKRNGADSVVWAVVWAGTVFCMTLPLLSVCCY